MNLKFFALVSIRTVKCGILHAWLMRGSHSGLYKYLPSVVKTKTIPLSQTIAFNTNNLEGFQSQYQDKYQDFEFQIPYKYQETGKISRHQAYDFPLLGIIKIHTYQEVALQWRWIVSVIYGSGWPTSRKDICCLQVSNKAFTMHSKLYLELYYIFKSNQIKSNFILVTDNTFLHTRASIFAIIGTQAGERAS